MIYVGKKIAVIGGDMRQISASNHLKKKTFNVQLYGFDKEYLNKDANMAESFEQAAFGAKVLLLGLPAADDTNINTSCWSGKLSINTFVSSLEKDVLVIGGSLSAALKAALDEKGIKYADYLQREEFAVLNAVPTAEGAIEIAMKELPVTLSGLKCLVVGYGRIGKVLAKSLKGLGADVSCSARKCSDLAWISVSGFNPVQTSRISEEIHEYPLIFNTVPHMMFDKNMLGLVRGDALIIDLASKPGGIDFDRAKELGIKVIWALSLPGKVAPDSAGKIIADTVINIINEI